MNNEDPWVRSMKQAPPPRTLREALTRIFCLYTAREMQTLIPTRAGQYGAGVYISPNERNRERTHTTVQRPVSTIQRHLAQARGSRRLAQQSEGEVMEDYLLQAVERGQAYEAGLAMVQAMIDFGILDPLREDPELGYLLEGLRQIGAMREPPVEHAFSLLYAITELLPEALQENLSFLADEDAVNDLANRALDPPDDLMRRREERDRKEAEERSRRLREDPEFEEDRQWEALSQRIRQLSVLENQGHIFTPDQMAAVDEILNHYFSFSSDHTPEEIGHLLDHLLSEIQGAVTPEAPQGLEVAEPVPMKKKHPHHKPKTQPMGWYRSRRH